MPLGEGMQDLPHGVRRNELAIYAMDAVLGHGLIHVRPASSGSISSCHPVHRQRRTPTRLWILLMYGVTEMR